jgi:hypothetical protein
MREPPREETIAQAVIFIPALALGSSGNNPFIGLTDNA